MPKLMFAVFAEKVLVDKFTNLVDIHNVIEQLHIPEPPPKAMAKAKEQRKQLVARGQMILLLHWRRNDPKKPEGKYVSRLQLVSPSGKVLVTTLQDFTLREHAYVRNLIRHDGLPVAGPGTYTARISLRRGSRWIPAGQTSFELAYIKPPAVRTEQPALH